MTLSDERLREIAEVYFGATRHEGVSMARELLSRRASPHGEAGVEPVAWPETLTGDALSLAMDAYELIGGLDGAVKSAEDHVQIIWQAIRSALSAPGSSAGAEPYIVIDEEGNTLVPDDQAAAIKAAFDAVEPFAPFGKPLRKALKFALASAPPQREGPSDQFMEFVDRWTWGNNITAEEALSCIQHHPILTNWRKRRALTGKGGE